MHKQTLLASLSLVMSLAASNAFAADTNVTDFAKNGNLWNEVGIPVFDGPLTAANAFGTTFDILSDGSGHNFAGVGSPGHDATLTVNVGIFGATDVYTLINGFNPYDTDPMTQIDVYGDAGAHDIFTLVNGTDVRDFNNYIFATTINGTTTQQAFTGQGPDGQKVFDEQHLTLTPDFAGQTLTQIVFTNEAVLTGRHTDSFPFLSGISVHSLTATPEPATLAPFVLGGLALLSLSRRARKG